jgi:uncharacterized protein YcfL
MKKLKLTALISISVVALSGCSKPEATATTEPVSQSQQIASKSPEGDIYAMAYKLCNKVCEKNASVIMTWGRPTEIGIAYFDDRVTQVNVKLITSIDAGRGMQTYFMVKSKGSLPGQVEPIPTERFVPTETYQNILVQSSGVDGKRKPIYGHIEILQIKKMPRTPGLDAANFATSSLKARLYDTYIVKPDTVNAYLYMTKDKPDIVPQQVEPITWQEGQPPQVIPVKAW